jgi:NitT/TauT family transport system permease protein
LKSKHTRAIYGITAVILFLILWQLVAFFKLLLLPTPVETFATFLTLIVQGEPILGKTLQDHAAASLTRVLESALIAFVLGIPVGVAISWYRRFNNFVSPLIEIFRPIPPIAWIPLAYVLFSVYGNTVLLAQIFIVALGVFFPTVLNVAIGVKSIDPILIDAAKTLGADEGQILMKVVLPAIVPSMITGMRIGLGVGWASIVAAEFVGGNGTGLGYFIWSMYQVGGRLPEIISGMIVIGIIGFIMSEGVLYLQRRLLPWS